MFDLELLVRLVLIAAMFGIGIIMWPKIKKLRPQRSKDDRRVGIDFDVSASADEIVEVVSNDRMAAGHTTAVAAKMVDAKHL